MFDPLIDYLVPKNINLIKLKKFILARGIKKLIEVLENVNKYLLNYYNYNLFRFIAFIALNILHVNSHLE